MGGAKERVVRKYRYIGERDRDRMRGTRQTTTKKEVETDRSTQRVEVGGRETEPGKAYRHYNSSIAAKNSVQCSNLLNEQSLLTAILSYFKPHSICKQWGETATERVRTENEDTFRQAETES